MNETTEIIHGRSYSYIKLKCRCEECTAANTAKGREWRENNLDKTREVKNKSYRKKIDYLNQFKREAGCIDCGYNENAVALDFDHIKGEKEFSLARAGNYGWKKVLAEIEKCEVVCANCHRIRTQERGQHYTS